MASDPQRATAQAMRAEIERTRVELNDSLLELRREVVSRVDWRRVVREHPVRLLVGAFAIGLFLGCRR